ncbi:MULTISPECIES: hypothetical protein [Photobacterium]|uniref:Uncharacterized protein n=1 Tax=Photobacterium leiognathi lrivu.4.1 TaxID=1248232 RepID=V5F6L6_PHOLE|nr:MULTISPECIES: hypothetical protein [Photobacterium]KPA53016.1 hypothetical protein VT25_09555 [Photobacterium leiognathi subsp. mandapamensis]MBP2700970.1 hypothetical protein [Vibrio parahaemolyticus]MZG56303.1 hypothetical protein [Photobacterium lucens]MZG82123.1 hypothetical protein [Photobacterium lucens]GAD28457.1 conserved hypothetical protein [Photobacterium leiognathi lrivu.4.1]
MYKYLLATLCLTFATSGVAATKYQHCTTADRSEVCQAYLQGLSDGKKEDTKVISSKSSFQERALEQRGGERYRKQDRFNRQQAG